MVWSEIEEYAGRCVVDATESLAADVGRWLVARGHGDLWPALFAELASSEHGYAIGDDDPDAGPLPPGAAWRFLERER
jgi:hypothetical protein